jgi:hypothetical protein
MVIAAEREQADEIEEWLWEAWEIACGTRKDPSSKVFKAVQQSIARNVTGV